MFWEAAGLEEDLGEPLFTTPNLGFRLIAGYFYRFDNRPEVKAVSSTILPSFLVSWTPSR